MLRKQDIENYSHNFNVFLLPLFNPILASCLHTWGSPDWLLLDFFLFFSRLQWNPAAFQGHRAKGPGSGSADIFLFVSVCDLKSQGWQLSGQKRDSRC